MLRRLARYNTKMTQYTKVNLKMDRDMEKVNRSGRMAVFMKAIGIKIKLMGRRKDKVYI